MQEHPNYLKTLPQDLTAGLVVFLVALPLCLGVALASGAPMISGIIAGVVGGLMVAWLSGSHTSISGPAAGLTAIIFAQIELLGSLEALLVATMIAGVMQMALAAMKAGSLASFFPSSIIKGLLAAIGIILILKQIPHLFGYDKDWFGDMTFQQLDGENTFSELIVTYFHIHPGAMIIGLASLTLLLLWDKTPLSKTPVPAPLIVVMLGIIMALIFQPMNDMLNIANGHLVQVPFEGTLSERLSMIPRPDFSSFFNPLVWMAAVTIAIVASLETLLNLDAVDKLDKQKRVSPPNRELFAQGAGNMVSGFLGGLPITSVIVSSSVNISAGGMTRMACFIHGLLLLLTVMFIPNLLNMIPLSCLAAILIATGLKLAKPQIFKDMWLEGRIQFIPFVITVLAIVLTDLLIGILIGLASAAGFILYSNLKTPLRQIMERHVSGDVLRIELANQVTFLNRATLTQTLHGLDNDSHVIIDASNSVFIDPDIITLIHEFQAEFAPAHNIKVSLRGFDQEHNLQDKITFVDVTTREIQSQATPDNILTLLQEGNIRFVDDQPINRDNRRQVDITADGQFPLAVVLSCMDSRIATEKLFDVGLGDLFSVRVAGNIVSPMQLGSLEFDCAIAGAKLLVVLGHTRCGAVSATINQLSHDNRQQDLPVCDNLSHITDKIAEAVKAETQTTTERHSGNERFVNRVTEINVRRTMDDIQRHSGTLNQLIADNKIKLVGAIYDVETGAVNFL